MKVLAILAVFLLTLGAVSALEAGHDSSELITINLRTCVDAGDGVCLTGGDSTVDGALVCLRKAGGNPVCGFTEDGELWFDSQTHGSYWATLESVPEGYIFVSSTCSTFPANRYQPCQSHGTAVHVVIQGNAKNVGNAGGINVNFSLAPN